MTKRVLFQQDYDPHQREIRREKPHLDVIEYILENLDVVKAVPIYVTVVINYRGEHKITGRVRAVANNNLVIENNPLPDHGAIRFRMDMFSRHGLKWALEDMEDGIYREYAHLAKSQDTILEVYMKKEDMTNRVFAKTLTKEI